jgi:hypothetical protein
LRTCIFLLIFSAASAAVAQQWEFTQERDRMDDKNWTYLRLKAEPSELVDRIPTLMIRCTEGKIRNDGWGKKKIYADIPDVYVVTGTPVHGSGYDHTIRIRFDDQKLESDLWTDSENFSAVFHTTATVKGQIRFIERIAAAKKMLFEFTPYMGSRTIAEFNVAGLSDQLPKMSEACGWPQVQENGK